MLNTHLMRWMSFGLSLLALAGTLWPGRVALAGSEYPWNGYRVYLSPAKHNPENLGCHKYAESAGARAIAHAAGEWLMRIGYMVRIGAGDYRMNTADSNAWGSDVHIPIHSNATPIQDCSGSDPWKGGTWLMYAEGADARLAYDIFSRMRGLSPSANDRIGTDVALSGKKLSWFSDRKAGMVKDVSLAGGAVLVNFADFSQIIPNAATSAGSAELLAELNDAVFAFSDVKEVLYQFDGSCEAFASWQESICEPITREAWKGRSR